MPRIGLPPTLKDAFWHDRPVFAGGVPRPAASGAQFSFLYVVVAPNLS